MPGISECDVRWLVEVNADPNGALFWHQGELFRAMRRQDADFYRQLICDVAGNDGLRDRVCPTRLTKLQVGRTSAVLRHDVIDPVTKPREWSPLMFKEAALCHCDLHLDLLEQGYDLQDAHPWNITFDGPRPVFLDYGSFVPRDRRAGLHRPLVQSYFNYWLHPLFLISKGHAVKCRRYLRNSDPPLSVRDLRGYMGPGDRLRYAALKYTLALNRLIAKAGGGGDWTSVKTLRELRAYLAALPIPGGQSMWRGYHNDEMARDPSQWHAKQRNLTSLFEELRPKTVLDVGCATGWYSLAAARAGAKVTALDIDDEIVDGVYQQARREQLPITGGVINLFQELPENVKYRSEMVLALALVHHLVFSQDRSFESICRVLAGFAEKWLVVEFIGPGDNFVRANRKPRHDFYTLENLTTALNKHFGEIVVRPSTSENRTLLVCAK